jgi:hypothetical protein
MTDPSVAAVSINESEVTAGGNLVSSIVATHSPNGNVTAKA